MTGSGESQQESRPLSAWPTHLQKSLSESLLIPPPPPPPPKPPVIACFPEVENLVGFILMGSVHLAVEKDICHFAIQDQTHGGLNDCDNRECSHRLKFQHYL